MMYKFMSIVKFNDKYFEHGDEVVVTKNDDSAIVGSIIINDGEGHETCHWILYLDVSEKHHKKTVSVMHDDIKNIQKVNG